MPNFAKKPEPKSQKPHTKFLRKQEFSDSSNDSYDDEDSDSSTEYHQQ